MGCSSSKSSAITVKQTSTTSPQGQAPISVEPKKKANLKEHDHSLAVSNDNENRINLVLKVKRENVFTQGFDLAEFSCTTKGPEKTGQQEDLIRNALSDNFIFAGVGNEEITLLVKAMGIQDVEKGENVIVEGAEGDFFYIISSGSFAVIKKDVTVVTLGSGKCFGELALMSNTPRGATVRAESDGVLFTLDRDTFRFILASSSASRMAMITKALEKVPLLQGLTSEQFQKIADSVEVIKYAPDEYIIRKGTEGNIFYILQEGKVKITDIGTATQYGDHELEAGTFFGERALLTAEPRTANVIAATPVQVLALDRLSFDSILGPLRDIMDFNTTLMSVNNIGLLEHLDEKIRTRIVKALSSESYPAGYTIIKQGDIGDKLFIIREGSAKIIKDGVDMGLLAAGQFFGEGALIEDETRIATIYAETKCKVFTLDRATFMRIGGKSVRNSGSMKSVKGWMDKLDTGDSPKAKEDHKRPATSTGGSDKVTPMVKYNFTDLKEIGLLGTGSFGRVSLVQHLQEKKVYALKAMLKYQIVTNKQEKNVVQEKHVMAESDHPFILKLYSTFKDERYIYMLLEVIPGGELFSVIHTRKGDGVPDEHVKFYGCCIMQAIAYLHAKDIAYRDMKPENCLIDAMGYPKLVDFGFAKKIGNGKTYTLCGTPEYLAPEIVLGKGHNKAVDYWAFGVLLYEMEAGYSPFCDANGADQVVIFKNIVNAKPHFPKAFNENLKDLVRHLLKPDVGARLGNLRGGAEEVLRHQWFNVDISAIYQKRITAPWIPKLKGQLDLSHFDGTEHKTKRLGPIVDCKKWDHEF